jgi:hypothetical protein
MVPVINAAHEHQIPRILGISSQEPYTFQRSLLFYTVSLEKQSESIDARMS